MKRELQTPNEIDPRDAAMLVLGGIRAMDRLTEVINAEVMRTMILFQEKKMFEAFDFTRMADFLDKSPLSPMTKNQFYDRKELFEKEGEHVFDLLNSAKIPLSVRKRLGAGNVELDGDKIIVRDGERETSIEAANRTGLLEALAALADANAEKTKKLKKGEEDFRREREKRLAAEDGQGQESGHKITKLDKLHTVAIGGLAALAAELEKATEAECLHYADASVALLASQFNRINALLAEKVGVDSIAQLEASADDERLAGLLDDED